MPANSLNSAFKRATIETESRQVLSYCSFVSGLLGACPGLLDIPFPTVKAVG